MARMTCTGCKRTKPCEEFGPDARKASGKRARCRACDAAATKERKARAKRGPAEVLPGPWKPLAAAPEPDPLDAMTDRLEAHQRALEAVAHAQAVVGLGAQAKALELALAKLPEDDRNAPAIALARSLARAYDAVPADDVHGVALLAPKLQASLRALGLEPRERRAAGEASSAKLGRFSSNY